MGAHVPKPEPADNGSAEELLSSLTTITAKERRKHASVFNYWLSIRGSRQLPPIRDLDPLEISDAGPFSVLLEMIGGAEDAEIRHLGQAIRQGAGAERINEAPKRSLLACIRAKLPAVATSGQALAFEGEYDDDSGKRRCCVTLLPFSANGAWIDYIYGFVSLEDQTGQESAAVDEAEPGTVPLRPLFEEDDGEAAAETAEQAPEASEAEPELDNAVEAAPETAAEAEEALEVEPELVESAAEPDAAPEEVAEPEPEPESEVEPEPEAIAEPCEEAADAAKMTAQPEPEAELAPEPVEEAVELEAQFEPETADDDAPSEEAPAGRPGFSARILEGLANLGGFYGQGVPTSPISHPAADLEHTEPEAPEEPASEPEPEQPTLAAEGKLHSKLNEVRALAEEARQAQIRSMTALYEGLSAAYDFALDAEQEPEEYLRLVEGQGLKIQLRSPMKPVVKLGFDGMCDEATIAELEAVLAWALKHDLPRGSLAERIEAAGGLGQLLQE
jgi:hypothetical protein